MDVPFASGVQIGMAFIWLGMVLAISFLEAPLKFRAPGITIELGVGIGRLVFTALNRVELVFGLVIVVATLVSPNSIGTTGWALLIAILLALTVQMFVLRPKMDRRFTSGQSESRAGRKLHIPYVVLECVKVVLLPLLALIVFRSL